MQGRREKKHRPYYVAMQEVKWRTTRILPQSSKGVICNSVFLNPSEK